MKNRIKLVTSVLMMAFFAVTASAQNYDYEYNDEVVIVNDYDNDRSVDNRRGDRRYDDRRPRKRGKNNVRNGRRWKASILDRAYAIAEADGRITRRERRELRAFENELGIYKLDNRGRRMCR